MVVVLTPSRDQTAGMVLVGEQMLIETLVPEAVIEALDKAVLHWFLRRDVVPLDPSLLLLFEEGVRCQFHAVAADHHAGSMLHAGPHADALRRISFAWRSSRFSRSSTFIFSVISVGTSAAMPFR